MRNKYVQELKSAELKGNKTECIRALSTIHSKAKVLFLVVFCWFFFSFIALIFLKLLLGQVNDWPLREPHTSLCSLAVRISQRLETFERIGLSCSVKSGAGDDRWERRSGFLRKEFVSPLPNYLMEAAGVRGRFQIRSLSAVLKSICDLNGCGWAPSDGCLQGEPSARRSALTCLKLQPAATHQLMQAGCERLQSWGNTEVNLQASGLFGALMTGPGAPLLEAPTSPPPPPPPHPAYPGLPRPAARPLSPDRPAPAVWHHPFTPRPSWRRRGGRRGNADAEPRAMTSSCTPTDSRSAHARPGFLAVPLRPPLRYVAQRSAGRCVWAPRVARVWSQWQPMWGFLS